MFFVVDPSTVDSFEPFWRDTSETTCCRNRWNMPPDRGFKTLKRRRGARGAKTFRTGPRGFFETPYMCFGGPAERRTDDRLVSGVRAVEADTTGTRPSQPKTHIFVIRRLRFIAKKIRHRLVRKPICSDNPPSSFCHCSRSWGRLSPLTLLGIVGGGWGRDCRSPKPTTCFRRS